MYGNQLDRLIHLIMPNKPEAQQPGVAPLYHALLSDPEAIHLSAAEAQAARSKLAVCVEAAPDLVARCVGRTTEEVRATLQLLWTQANARPKAV